MRVSERQRVNGQHRPAWPGNAMNGPPLLVATDVTRQYPVRGTRQVLTAVAGVSLTLRRGETLGIVGESGCGKSTLARLLVRLEAPTSGRIELDGRDVTALGHGALAEFRRRVQMVFQDPYASLNPRITVGRTLDEVLVVHRLGSRERPAPAGRRAARPRRVGGEVRRALSAPAVGRAAPARRYRPGPRRRARRSSSSTNRCRRSTCPCSRGS